MPEYVSFIRDFLSELDDVQKRYDELGKNTGTKRAGEKPKDMLRELLELRRSIWGMAWNKWPVSDWVFAFEEDVGSGDHHQYTWTTVYRNLPLIRTYLLLYLADDPMTFGRLLQLLKATAHNLSEGWEAREVKRLFGEFFAGASLDVVRYWQRWRGYLVRSNLSEDPMNPGLWEDAMNALLQIKAITTVQAHEQMKGLELITTLNKRVEEMIAENKHKIQEYLGTLFPAAAPDGADTKKAQEAKEKVRQFIEERSVDYARFVDVKSDGWKHLVDGLVCGWALKTVCRKLREDDYASVIGGRTLAKLHPSEVRSLMVDLVEKAVRSGDRPWNVDAPLELLFRWSLRNAYSVEARLFMDALSLGFMRFDRKANAQTGEKQ